MSPSYELSMRERQIMDAVYRLGEARVNEVAAAIPDPPTTTAVRTMLGNLEKKGYLKSRAEGRACVYTPKRRRETAARSALRRVLDIFFGGSITSAVSVHLADPRKRLSDEEIRELEQLIKREKSRR